MHSNPAATPTPLADFPKSLLYAAFLGAASFFLPWGSMVFDSGEKLRELLPTEHTAGFGFPASLEMNITVSPLSGGQINLRGLILPLWLLSLSTLVAPSLLFLRHRNRRILQATSAATTVASTTSTPTTASTTTAAANITNTTGSNWTEGNTGNAGTAPAAAATAATNATNAPPASSATPAQPSAASHRQHPAQTSPLYTPRLLSWRIALLMLLLISLLLISIDGSPQLGVLAAVVSSTLSLFPGRHPAPLP
jgi:hypothetical protein